MDGPTRRGRGAHAAPNAIRGSSRAALWNQILERVRHRCQLDAERVLERDQRREPRQDGDRCAQQEFEDLGLRPAEESACARNGERSQRGDHCTVPDPADKLCEAQPQRTAHA